MEVDSKDGLAGGGVRFAQAPRVASGRSEDARLFSTTNKKDPRLRILVLFVTVQATRVAERSGLCSCVI